MGLQMLANVARMEPRVVVFHRKCQMRMPRAFVAPNASNGRIVGIIVTQETLLFQLPDPLLLLVLIFAFSVRVQVVTGNALRVEPPAKPIVSFVFVPKKVFRRNFPRAASRATLPEDAVAHFLMNFRLIVASLCTVLVFEWKAALIICVGMRQRWNQIGILVVVVGHCEIDNRCESLQCRGNARLISCQTKDERRESPRRRKPRIFQALSEMRLRAHTSPSEVLGRNSLGQKTEKRHASGPSVALHSSVNCGHSNSAF